VLVAARKGLSLLRKMWEAHCPESPFYSSALVEDTHETLGQLALRFVQAGQTRRQLRRKKAS